MTQEPGAGAMLSVDTHHRVTLPQLIGWGFIVATQIVAVTIIWQRIESRLENAITSDQFNTAMGTINSQLQKNEGRIEQIENSRKERSADVQEQLRNLSEGQRPIPTIVYRVDKLEGSIGEVIEAVRALNLGLGQIGTKIEVVGGKVDTLAEQLKEQRDAMRYKPGAVPKELRPPREYPQQ